MASKVSLVILLLMLICVVKSARILGVFPMPARSHYILGNALMRGLAEKGHDVTVISPFQEKNPPKKGSYRDIHLIGLLETLQARRNASKMYEMADSHPFMSLVFVATVAPEMNDMLLRHPEVQKLINSKEKFDAVIVEQFLNDAHKGLATHFDAPLILFSTVGANFWVNPLVGNPSPPSYVPDLMTSYSSKMSFCERVTNSLMYVLNQEIHHWYLFPRHNKAIQNYIPNGPNIHDVLYNASIVLLNSHTSINEPVPIVPNMIEIGGFHVQPPKKLPQDLQEFLDSSPEGVVYFSMGSNLRSADLPLEKRDAILNVFSKLKQKVLWKWEEEVLPGQPPNVKLGKWLPQQDILAHPNIKLFITHGGLLSTTETVYHGVPTLAIPIFGDQKLNAKVAYNNGFGLILPYVELNENTFSEKLHDLLTNPKYGKSAKIVSQRFHDRQVKPMDNAAYWVEYVIRHKGAPHLRVAALDLSWYQYHLLDVIAFLTLVSVVSLLITYVIIKKILRKIYSKSCNKAKITKKNKKD